MGVLRSLGRLGVDVYGVYSDPSAEIARHSNSLRARYRVSDIHSNAEILHVLRSIRIRAGTPAKMVLIPCANDTLARFVSVHREVLQDDFLFRTPPPAIGETFLDKRATVDICRKYGMPIPTSFVPNTIEEIERAAGQLRFPVIIKPASHDEADFPGKNVVASSAGELVEFYRERTELIPRSMFQEVVPSGDGRIVTVTSYSDLRGSVLAQASSRKLRQWLPDTGSGCFSVSETLPHLLETTRTFLESIGYVGFSSIEYAEDAQSGEWRFLELNARVVYRNQQHADAGVDLTAIGYMEMCGDEPPRVLTQRDDVYWVDIHRDIPSFVVKWLRHELTFAEWLKSLRRASSFAIYYRHDLKPFVASIMRMLALGLGLASGGQARPNRSLLVRRLLSRPLGRHAR